MASLKLIRELKQCSETRDIEHGKTLHQQAVEVSLHTDKFVSSSLIKMYSRCNSMTLAQQVFDELSSKDVVTWNTLILGYVENGEPLKALKFFNGIDCVPNSGTYIAALKACGALAKKHVSEKHLFLEKGVTIYKDAKACGLDMDVAVSTTLIDMYGKCGDMNQAKLLFDRMTQHNVVTWNALLSGYVENGENSVALDLFFGMDCEPSHVTYMVVLRACGGLAHEEKPIRQRFLEKGIAIHERLKHSGVEHRKEVATTLMDMYCKCGSMRRARKIFDQMRVKDVVTWTSIILGYVENDECLKALELFFKMSCCPNSFTYVAALKAYGYMGAENGFENELWLERAVDLHEDVKRAKLEKDMMVATALVEMYCKYRSMTRAKEVFDQMNLLKNVFTWTTIMLGYIEREEYSKALDLYSSMDCEPSSVTYVAVLKVYSGMAGEKGAEKDVLLEKTILLHEQMKRKGLHCEQEIEVATTLLDTYWKCGSMELAKDVFEIMVHKDVVAWTSLISGYVDCGQSANAIDSFTFMDCKPDSLTYVAVLKACGSLVAVSIGKQIHHTVCKDGIEREQVVTGALMNFYAKSGSLVRALELFGNVQTPGIVLWNTLIAGYSSLGDSSQVFRMVEEIQEFGLEMDSVTFVCVLTACSRGGFVSIGKLYFQSMLRYGISPTVEHYNCMVDMFSRANRIQEALTLVCDMPFVANNVTWITLLGACNKLTDTDVGRATFNAMPENLYGG